ncbi:MAG TPA: HD domain-containing phosphohydrolase [Patescibacteria group bacterium]|nr:HD domain-containing phosphohydrolase [Patescibacteria group bacterium]
MTRIKEPILVIDDDQSILAVISTMLSVIGFDNIINATKGVEGIAAFKKYSPPIVLLDISLPDAMGLDLMDKIKALYPPSQIIIITGNTCNEFVVDALRKGACDFITKPITLEILKHSVTQCLEKHDLVRDNQMYQQQLEKLVKERTDNLAATNEKLAVANKDLSSVLYKTVEALSKTMEIRDPYTAGHQKRVTALAIKISEYYGLDESQIEHIKLAGMLHDIGKFYVPQELLVKPTRLSETEFKLLKKHVIEGYNIISDIPFEAPIARMVLQHHERLDGSGYPNGLRGDQISIEAKIISVADVVEAMASHRPYRASLGVTVAIEEIVKGSGKLYDDKVVEACLAVIKACNYDLDIIFK